MQLMYDVLIDDKINLINRLYRPKSDFIANVTVKQVKFADVKEDEGENDAVQKLEKMITEKFLKALRAS